MILLQKKYVDSYRGSFLSFISLILVFKKAAIVFFDRNVRLYCIYLKTSASYPKANKQIKKHDQHHIIHLKPSATRAVQKRTNHLVLLFHPQVPSEFLGEKYLVLTFYCSFCFFIISFLCF